MCGFVDIRKNGRRYATCGDDKADYKFMKSFEVTLFLHIMIEIIRIIDHMCHVLQQKSQDILNVVHLVTTTKTIIQEFRDDRLDGFLKDVILFCGRHDIDTPYCNAVYIECDGCARY